MITTCTDCHARYRLDAERVPHRKIRVRCPSCRGVFVLDGTDRTVEAVPPVAAARPEPRAPVRPAPEAPLASGAEGEQPIAEAVEQHLHYCTPVTRTRPAPSAAVGP